jgi:hypothetical protein
MVDVGCGRGATTVALAQKVGLTGSCFRHWRPGVEPGPGAANCTQGLGGRLRTLGTRFVKPQLYPLGFKSKG